ncbi:hypothetical protein [Neorhizobium alkalisoli]|uniref:hypothetical protein n=1 Tax=Neorhizobium alkalisoli TaxID=528178 RepID=UPI0011A199F8|nr:hypothetical protein [Neorhizobium alkalisoli]
MARAKTRVPLAKRYFFRENKTSVLELIAGSQVLKDHIDVNLFLDEAAVNDKVAFTDFTARLVALRASSKCTDRGRADGRHAILMKQSNSSKNAWQFRARNCLEWMSESEVALHCAETP